MKSKVLVAIAASCLGAAASAADWKPLEGTYAVTARNYLDPAEDEPRATHFRVQLEGAAARDLYLAMPAEPKPDACTGGLAKRVGEMTCTASAAESRYECHFSIDLRTQEIEYGVAC